MADGIFISYRRDDSRHAAGRLVDRLAQTFSRDQLFMDVDAIEPGHDFVSIIKEKIAACNVMLAVIGPQWLDARDEKGNRRLDNESDFVRVEIEAALKRDVRVIPVLVDGAQMPRQESLPEGLQPLVRRNAVRLAHERFGGDTDDLVQTLRRVVGARPSAWNFLRRRSGNKNGRSTRAHAHPLPMGASAGEERSGIWSSQLKWLVVATLVWQLVLVTVSLFAGIIWQENRMPHWWGKAPGGTGAAVASTLILAVGAWWITRQFPQRDLPFFVTFGLGIAAGLTTTIVWLNVK